MKTTTLALIALALAACAPQTPPVLRSDDGGGSGGLPAAAPVHPVTVNAAIREALAR